MEYDAMPVLRICQDAPRIHRRYIARRCPQINLSAAATATTVTPRLTHGPHNNVPAITAIAINGKNDLPIPALIPEKIPRHERSIWSSFPTEIQLCRILGAEANDQCSELPASGPNLGPPSCSQHTTCLCLKLSNPSPTLRPLHFDAVP